jgi:nucleoside-diphosphate-sugar epimerase
VAAQEACRDVDIVLHTVAIAKENGSLSQFRTVNVEGAVTIAKAAKAAGIKVFVHLSSVMVYGFKYPDLVTEEGLLQGEKNPYCQTKIESEQALLKLHDPPNFNVIIIRAGDVYGPGSLHWTIRPLLLMQKRLFILANEGQGVINHLYIDNLVDSIFLTLEKQTDGEIFNITDGQQTSWREFFIKLADIAKLPPPISLPARRTKDLIRLRCLSQKMLGKTPDLLPESVDFITRPHAYSIAKAQTQLGYEPRIDLEGGMQHIQTWLKSTDIFAQNGE